MNGQLHLDNLQCNNWNANAKLTFSIECHRLFHQHMLSILEHQLCHRVMISVDNSDVNDLHFRVQCQLFEPAVRFGYAVSLSKLLCLVQLPFGYGHELESHIIIVKTTKELAIVTWWSVFGKRLTTLTKSWAILPVLRTPHLVAIIRRSVFFQLSATGDELLMILNSETFSK